MSIYPLELGHVAKSAIWGGDRLVRDFGKETPYENLAESWELSVRERESSTVRNGIFAGKTLKEALQRLGNGAIGTRFAGGRFPLLVKLIDARDDLSVQVHPDDAYAARMEGDVGKTEMWHIVAAEPGATIIYGLSEGITAAELSVAAQTGNFGTALCRREVRAGETYFIPAGMLHAIGKGVLVAEVQQNCDLTYRVYDYGRIGADGNPRELHLAKALDVVHSFREDEVNALCFAGGDTDAIVSCPYFTVRRTELGSAFAGEIGSESFEHLLFLEGEGQIEHDGKTYPYRKGASYYLPAGLGAYRLCGTGAVLRSRL